MSAFDGYEDEALRDLATTLRRLSDGSVDEGDLVIWKRRAKKFSGASSRTGTSASS
jgi:hypothetical protein